MVSLAACDARSTPDPDAATPTPDGCVPDCTGRTCGPDPACGVICGACDGSCIDGRCERTMPGAPRILSFGTSTTMLLSEEETLTITAVLTDPDGIEDLVGGSLLDADSGATYGAFATSAEEGAYEMSLDMQRIYEVARVESIWPTSETVRFRARFFDQAGNEVTAEASVSVLCAAPADFVRGECRWLGESYTTSGGGCTHFVPNRSLDATCSEVCAALDDPPCSAARRGPTSLTCATTASADVVCDCGCSAGPPEGV
jgi:hypothetical protein